MGFVALVIIQLLVLAKAVNLLDVYPTYQSEGCSFFTSLDTSAVTTLDNAFSGSSLVCDGEPWQWDVSRVTSLESTFSSASVFNGDVGSWDVSRVTTMRSAFHYTYVFNSDIGSWDVSRVTTMFHVLHSNRVLDSNLGNWDVSRVRDMQRAFDDMTVFNSDIGSWDVSRVTDMLQAFAATPVFYGNLGSWCVTAVTSHTSFCTNCAEPIWGTCPTAAPGLTVVDPGNILRSVPLEGPFLVPDSTITAIPGQQHPPNAFVPVSPVVNIALTLDGAEVPVTSLQDPVVFVLNITNITDLTHTACVADGQLAATALLPECVFWNNSQEVWSAAGCKTSNVTPTTVTCGCLHLTEFSIALPSFNQLGQAEVRGLADLAKYPTTGIVLLSVLMAFAIAAVAASRVDLHKNSEEKKEAKRKKWHWEQKQGKAPDFVRSLKAKFQHSHPWFAVCFRQSGSSFLSVDRCLVLLVLVLCNMATTAAFWARPGDELLVRLVLSSMISFSTYEVLEQLFKRCGIVGFREEWEREQLTASANACQRCLQSRFPESVRLILRLVCFSLVCFLSVVILLYGVKFDLGPSFFCNNANGAKSWLLTFLVVTLGDILVSRPIKLVVWHGLKFAVQKRRQKSAAIELKEIRTHKKQKKQPSKQPWK